MTELPRYVGRHASPEAAAPSSESASPEENAASAEPAMPRLDFEPSVSEEPTTIIDPSPDLAATNASDDVPPADPEPAADRPTPTGSARRWNDRGRVERPSPEPPTPEALRPGPPGVAGLPPLRAASDEPSGEPAPNDPWTAQAPDIASGPAPEPSAEPLAESEPPAEPEPPEPPAEPEPPAGFEVEAVETEAAPPETWADVEPESELAPEPAPEPEAITESESQPEAEPDMPLRPEPDWTPTPEFASSATPASRPVSVVREVGSKDTDTHGLARMALLDAVQEIWPGGTPDLSAWLASNLELLEDPLGFSLTPRHHVPALSDGPLLGGYDVDQSPLDIPGNLLTADLSGAAVMVRAQVGPADTDGLGALLSAAAAAQAKTAVWVCPRLDSSLRQTLRWIGGDPSANVRIYGLEMYLVQIAGSPTAPLFDAVVSPGTP